MTQLSDNMRGALLMMACMAAFSFGDATVKAIGEAIPLGQLLVLRGLLSSAFLLWLAWRLGALRWTFAAKDWGLIGLRSLGEVGAAYFFLTALFHMPIANVTALLQMLPLTVTLGSAIVFSEPVGLRRWLAIGVGFVGMLLIVKPGTEGFTIHTTYALLAVVCVTLRDLSTRRLSREVPSLMVTLCASLAVLGFAALLSLGQDWQPMDLRLSLLVLATGVFIVGGYAFSVLVMRSGDIGFVAPFRYTGLIWALLLGWVVFDEWPGPLTLLGAGIVVATGVYTLWRERQVAAKTRAT